MSFLNKYATDRGPALEVGLASPAASGPPSSPNPNTAAGASVNASQGLSLSSGGMGAPVQLANGSIFCSYPIAPPIDLQNPDIVSRISDHVIATAHSQYVATYRRIHLRNVWG